MDARQAFTDVLFEMYDDAKRDAIFYTTLLCNLEVIFTSEIPTACVDGVKLRINPEFFLKLPIKSREFIIMHEIRHISGLHLDRMEGRTLRRWNFACDYVINWELQKEGYTFQGLNPLIDARYAGMTAEQVYDLLPEPPEDQSCFGLGDADGDMELPANASEAAQAAEDQREAVRSAIQACTLQGYSSELTEALYSEVLKRTEPSVNWRAAIREFFTKRLQVGLNYNKRNRRYRHIVLPGKGSRNQIENLKVFIDTSGSTTDEMVSQAVHDCQFIFDNYAPDKMSISLFDTRITKTYELQSGRKVPNIQIVGRGGTSLEPVAKMIVDEKATAVVIFTDLECPPMEVIKGIPIVWVCINNPTASVNQGRLIHVKV